MPHKIKIGTERGEPSAADVPDLPMIQMPDLPAPPDQMPLMPDDRRRAWAGAPNPSTTAVQQAYLARREEEAKEVMPFFKPAALAAIEEYLRTLPGWGLLGVTARDVKNAYKHINRSLQAADLTINFEAQLWFAQENPYHSYMQMYERAVGANGVMVVTDDMRVRADNTLSFPPTWSQEQAVGRRGLSPQVQSGARIKARMHTGKLVQADPNNMSVGYTSSNPRFNPRTRQVFAALNYDRCERGGAPGYGKSHLILNPELKQEALYYPMDSFDSYEAGAIAQVPYEHLASIIGVVKHQKSILKSKGNALVNAIFESCYQGIPDQEGARRPTLLEAHLFSEIRFRDHVQAIVISPATDYQNAPHSEIVANAKKFAQKHGIQIYQSR